LDNGKRRNNAQAETGPRLLPMRSSGLCHAAGGKVECSLAYREGSGDSLMGSGNNGVELPRRRRAPVASGGLRVDLQHGEEV
jgi:hypothetical protein